MGGKERTPGSPARFTDLLAWFFCGGGESGGPPHSGSRLLTQKHRRAHGDREKVAMIGNMLPQDKGSCALTEKPPSISQSP